MNRVFYNAYTAGEMGDSKEFTTPTLLEGEALQRAVLAHWLQWTANEFGLDNDEDEDPNTWKCAFRAYDEGNDVTFVRYEPYRGEDVTFIIQPG